MQGPTRAAVITILTTIAATSVVVTGHAAVIIDSLTIRVYDTAGVLAAERAQAMRAADDVLAGAQIYVTWRDCTPTAAKLPVDCASVPTATDLLVRIGRAPKESGGGTARSLGYSLIDTAARRGLLATVYADRVEWLATRARVARNALLGKAIAHELGHLVLGSNEHSDRGLMRAVWTAEEVTRNQPGDWAFSPLNRAQLLNAWVNGVTRPRT